MVKKTKQKHQLRHAVVGTLGALGFMTLTTQAASASQVTVKPGDTVWGIAQQHGLTTKAIEDANPTTIKKISSTVDLIQAGQKLTLPDGHDNGEAAGSINTTANTTPQAGNNVNGVNAGTGQITSSVNVPTNVANQQTVSSMPASQTNAPAMGQTSTLPGVRSQANDYRGINTTQASTASTSAAQYQVSTQESTAAAMAGQAQSGNGNQQVANASAAVQTVSQPLAVSAQLVNSSTTSEAGLVTTATPTSVSQQPVQSQPMQGQTSAVSTNASQPVVSSQPAQSQPTQSQLAQGQTPVASTSASQQPAASGQPIQTQPAQGQTSVVPSQSQAVASSTPASATPTTSQASQPQQSQSQQSTVTTPQTPQTSASDNLQSGSVVSLATKIASSNSVPYVWGGNSLSGMDCSGLVDYVYAHAENKQLPHNSTMLESYVNQHAVSEAQPGDLLFWGNHGSSYHVAIYTGNNQYVAAAQPGTNVSLYTLSPYFAPSFAGTVK